jgi:hypothetical protein
VRTETKSSVTGIKSEPEKLKLLWQSIDEDTFLPKLPAGNKIRPLRCWKIPSKLQGS